MTGSKAKAAALARAGLEGMAEQAEGDARKLAAVAELALANGMTERAYELARRARQLEPDNADIRSMTDLPLTAGVPSWHFQIVRDEARNEAYEAALKRAIGAETTVLEIGTGTGLLAMMAARAGAKSVVTCEMNRAVADAATEIVALNGYSERVRVVAKRSTDLDVDGDLGGAADLLVSEIVSNDLLRESALPVMEDAVRRLLKPGGRMIPSSGTIRIALAYWSELDRKRLGRVAGFDVSPFNRLAKYPRRIKTDDPSLILRGDGVDLFEFDFTSGGPYAGRRTSLDLAGRSGRVNGIAQWIGLRLDDEISYENKPASGARSCWACLFYPFDRDIELEESGTIRVNAAHGRESVRIWIEPEG
jgi:SAM-dependent methyltransferase